MRFAILGPLEVSGEDGQRLPLGGPQQRALLAVLLLNAGRVVSTDRLIECLWGEEPPAAARSLLQGCVAGLRRALKAGAGPDRQPLVTRAPGYCVEVRPDELDLDRFERLAAATQLTEALALWRGPALDGLDGTALSACQADIARLEERRLAVLEQRIDADLRAGRHASLVGELESLVRAHPLRERLWALLMIALYRADRQADALAAYQRLRRTLVDQLGMEPSATLRRVQGAILSGTDPAKPDESTENAGTEPTRPVPAQLPPAVAAFTGRDEHLKYLDTLLPDGAGAAAIGVISGTAGVGKTALAIHWAHRVREWFADGQLYVNLHGYAPAPPMRPIEALAGFLQALGTPAEAVPVELDRASALYRTLVADKRMLVVLDNAYSADQVRPLLPGSAGCVVLVTSRDRLAGMVARDGARHLTLDVLGHHEAVTLLVRVLGAQRVQAEPEAGAELVERCARLPLALRIAAANLACHPRRRIADQVADLVADDRLSALEIDGDADSAVRVAFDLSYDALAAPARLLFRRLGLVPGPDVTTAAAAALVARSPAEPPEQQTSRLLDELTSAHLLDQDDQGRYTLHDLLRLYAKERADGEDTAAERDAATRRLFDWYLRTADAAARQLYPTALRLPIPESTAPESTAPDSTEPMAGFADHTAALAWLDGELANLVAAVQYTAESGPRSVAWLLADTLRGYFMLRVLPVEWAVVADAARSAAEVDGEPRAQMAAELNLASRHMRQSRFDPAIDHYRRALAINERVGWPEGESAALGNLGIVYLSSGQLRSASEHFAQALAVDRRIGWLGGQAVKLGNLGVVDRQLGRLDEAAAHFREALALFHEVGSRHGEALAVANLGAVLHLLGRYPEAIDHVTRAIALHQEIGDRGTEADDQNVLAEVHRDVGRLPVALDLAEAALTRAVEVGERHYEADAHNVLGSVHLRLGAPGRAAEHHQRALDLATSTDLRLPKVTALIGLAATRCALGDPEQGRRYADQAIALSQAADSRLLEGRARTALADALTDLGQPSAAADEARLALDIQQTTGYQLGAADALLALGRALARSNPDAALAHRQRAAEIRSGIGAAG
jgi:DNA-binding SARP family transcriptional activator/tetratricopeptide (TPR) repeat protein